MASGTMCSKELLKVLTTPSKIASALDWKKQIGSTIATIDVHADRIGMTISSHPESSSSSSLSSSSSSSVVIHNSTLFSVPIHKKGRRKIPDSSRQQLSELVHAHNVCGFVVSWPIQKDTKLMGASCGRTLFAIEELLSSPSSPQSSTGELVESASSSTMMNDTIFTRNRKLCLWSSSSSSSSSSPMNDEVDVFGRSPVYARTTDKTVHRASQEQYHEDEAIVATQVWEDFVQTNWSEIYQQNQQQQQQQQHRLSSPSSMMTSSYQQQCQQGKKTVLAVAA